MSAPLRLNPYAVTKLGDALKQLTDTTRATGVRFDGNGFLDVTVNGSASISVRWNDDDREYVIDDQIGN